MKNTIIVILIFVLAFCKAQTYPLRTYGITFPKDSYVKDTNNELQSYEGTWKGTWDNKTILIYLKKTKSYFDHLEATPYYIDILKGKFKVIDANGTILFDNMSISDDEAKIEGSTFRKKDNKYSLSYYDPDICGSSGYIMINFTDSTKTKLNWKFNDTTDIITSSCPYYNTNPFPDPLPKEIVLTKQ